MHCAIEAKHGLKNPGSHCNGKEMRKDSPGVREIEPNMEEE